MLSRSDLDEKQIKLIRRFKKKKRTMACVYMGFGKTVCSLTAVRDLLKEGKVKHVLIVAPKRVATDTWPDEIHEWKHLRKLKYAVMVGTPAQRLSALNRRVQIHIINRENLPWLWKATRNGKDWIWDMMIYDEFSRMKAGRRRTARKKDEDGEFVSGGNMSEFGVLCAARNQKVNRVIELSGTPAPNGHIDLWGPAYIIDLGKRLKPTRTEFLQKYFDSDYMGWTYKLKKGAGDKIMDKLSDVMVAYEDPQLEKRVFYKRYIKLPEKLMKEYRRFNRDLVSEEYDVEALSAGVLTNKLLQFSNGSMYRNLEDGKREVVHIHDHKLEELESIVNESGDAPIMVSYSYKFDLKRIKKKFPKAVVFDEDPKAKDKWNKGKIKMLLCHPASMGHGLNLQHGGYIQVWYGLTWSLELFQQFNKRLARRGQKRTVRIYVIMAKGTNDEVVYKSMRTKGMTQDKITERVSEHAKQMAA